MTTTAKRIAAIPDWYWRHYPEARQRVLDGDTDLLDYIEQKLDDWRTDPLD